MSWYKGYRVHVMVQSACHGSEYMSWFRVHVMVQSACHGSEYTSWYRVHVMVQSTCHGSEYMSWYRVHVMVQSTCYGSEYMSWYKVHVMVQSACHSVGHSDTGECVPWTVFCWIIRIIQQNIWRSKITECSDVISLLSDADRLQETYFTGQKRVADAGILRGWGLCMNNWWGGGAEEVPCRARGMGERCNMRITRIWERGIPSRLHTLCALKFLAKHPFKCIWALTIMHNVSSCNQLSKTCHIKCRREHTNLNRMDTTPCTINTSCNLTLDINSFSA